MDSKWIKKIILSIVDISAFTLAILIAYLIKFDEIYRTAIPWSMSVFVVLAMIIGIKYLSMISFSMYSKIWRFAGMNELRDVVLSCLLGTSIGMAMLFLMSRQVEFNYIIIPRSIMVLAFILDVSFIGGSRIVYRAILNVTPKEIRKNQLMKRTLIYGAGRAGVVAIKELNASQFGNLKPVGFIDDDYSKKGHKLNGLPIFGGKKELEKVALKENIEVIIIAMPSASSEKLKEAINASKETGATVSILPRVHDIIDGALQVSKIRPVEIEDLLGRSQVKIDNDVVSGYINSKCVMVTGGGGSIGSELCRQIAKYKPAKLLIVDIYENNAYEIQQELRRTNPELNMKVLIASVRDRERISYIMKHEKPEVVFHAAAHKHVPLMEESPQEAIKNNVFGTRNMVELSNAFKVQKFVLISTDKAVNPTNIMGATKRLCEMIVQSYSQVEGVTTHYAAVRFGNVLGSNGSVIPLFKKQIQAGGPVTVTHPEVVRYFMTIPEAVQLVIQAGGLAQKGEVFVLDMGEPVKIDNLARDLIRLSGFKPDEEIKIVYSGLRPGEKLYEELLMGEEGLDDTTYEKIFIANPITQPYERLIENLEKIKGTYDHQEELIRELKRIVPTFKAPEEINRVSFYNSLAQTDDN